MTDRIKEMLQSDRLFFMAVVLLVGFVSYGLGRQAGLLEGAIGHTQPAAAMVFVAAPETVLLPDAISVVASRGGTKYHLPDCPGAQTIKEANLIRFASLDLARAAGYLPAGNCRGLK